MGKMTYAELEALCERFSKQLTAVRSERVVLEEELAVMRNEAERFKTVWGICIEHYRSVTDKNCPYCRYEAAMLALQTERSAHDEIMAQKFEEKRAQEANLANAEKKIDGYNLAPCPLCGARADFIEDTDFQCHYIGCSNSKCGITLFATKHQSINEQIAAWNNREFIKACFLRGL